MDSKQSLVEAALGWAKDFFRKQIDAEYVFHDFEHTLQVWAAVRKIGHAYGLSPADQEVLELAAIFHDTGFDKGAEHHEERSCRHAATWLRARHYPEPQLAQVLACILATRMPQQPQTFLERVLCDADLCHLGLDVYPDRSNRIRQELLMTRGLLMDEREWLEFELRLLRDHRYFTSVAELLFGPGKRMHMARLEARYQKVKSPVWETVDQLAEAQKKQEVSQDAAAEATPPSLADGALPEEAPTAGTGAARLFVPARHWRRLQQAAAAALLGSPLLWALLWQLGQPVPWLPALIVASCAAGTWLWVRRRSDEQQTAMPDDLYRGWTVLAMGLAVALMLAFMVHVPL